MRKRLLLFLLLLCCSIASPAQVVWENQIWSSAGVKFKLRGPWSISVTPEARFRLSPVMLRTFFPDVNVAYDITKKLSAGLHYRYQYTNESRGNYYFNHSVLAEASYKIKWEKFQFAFRLRGGTLDDGTPEPDLFNWLAWEVRERFLTDYKLNKRTDLYAGIELFQMPVEGLDELQQMRITGGVERELTKTQKIQVGVLFQNRPALKRINPVISYTLEIEQKKKPKAATQQP